MRVDCLDVCAKNGVTVARAGNPGVLTIVPAGAFMEDIVRDLGPVPSRLMQAGLMQEGMPDVAIAAGLKHLGPGCVDAVDHVADDEAADGGVVEAEAAVTINDEYVLGIMSAAQEAEIIDGLF
jgi:hypothetical protein